MPRGKKAVVDSSDAEDETVKSPRSIRKAGNGAIEAAFAKAKTRAAFGKSNETASLRKSLPVRNAVSPSKPSAVKTRSASNSPAKARSSNNKKILSFFNNATQLRGLQASRSPEKTGSPSLDIEDDVINDSSDDGDQSSSTAHAVDRGTKRKLSTQSAAGLTTGSNKPQKFMRLTPTPGVASTNGTVTAKVVDKRPWTDQYGPANLDELAVHKRKIQDVRDWLSQTIARSSTKRLLVLKGAAGTGKTTTVRLIAQQLCLTLTEWHNPDVVSSTVTKESLAIQFEEFVNRTSRFGSLRFTENALSDTRQNYKDRDQLILLEEFPNTYSQSSGVLQGFRRAVLQFLTTSTPPDFFTKTSADESIIPVVMIISESMLTTSTASADSFTAHRLLGSEILNHAGTTIIEFNAIAPTFMSKALDLILVKDARRSGRRFAPGTAVLSHLSEIGDIRSAVSALEFFCLHRGGEQDWSGKIQFAKGKKRAAPAKLTTMEKESLELITQREHTLGIFHAVGKVVYNKRELPASTSTPAPQPGPWLPQYHRDKVSLMDVDALLNELGTDIHVFILALHENYVLSCEGLEAEDTLDSINGCLDSISDADLLSPERFSANASRFAFAGSTTDALRQDEISFDTCVRGMLFNLPHPVKRVSPPPEYVAGRGRQARGMTGFQMLFPTALRLWRKKEQIEGLVELFNDKFRKHELESVGRTQKDPSESGGVLSWRNQPWGDIALAKARPKEEKEEKTSVVLRGASRSELLLERLPYFIKLERQKPPHSRTWLSKQLARVVTFNGLMNILSNEDEEQSDAEDAQDQEEWSTDKPVESPLSYKKKGPGIVIQHNKTQDDVNEHVERLILSDDDIVDD